MAQNSRLTRNREKQTKQQIIVSIVGIIIVIFIIFKFSGTVIGWIGDVVFNFEGNKQTTVASQPNTILNPPTLNQIPNASSNSTISVSGTTEYNDVTAEVNVNGTLYKNIPVNNGKFTQDGIQLQNGTNTIEARVVKDNNSSDYSEQYTIAYQKNNPQLEVNFPSDGQTFQKADQQITITGKVDDSTDTVAVNQHQAVVNQDGSFSYYLQLNSGSNDIKIEAVNEAGGKTDKEMHVTYNP